MDQIIRKSFFLSAGDANAEGELSLPVLTNKIIEIATEHANSLGIGNPDMADIHAGWVLSRLTIQMDYYPKVNESYTISTWIEDFNRHFSTRNFKIESENGKVCGYARSIWIVMDSVERSLLSLSHLSLPENMISGENVPIPRQEKHIPVLPQETGEKTQKKFIPATHPQFDYQFAFCDIDSYRHVNTVRYVTLLLNQFSLEEHDKTMVRRLELSFLHEASFGLRTSLFRADSAEKPLDSIFQLSDTKDFSPLLFSRVYRQNR